MSFFEIFLSRDFKHMERNIPMIIENSLLLFEKLILHIYILIHRLRM